MSPVASDYGSPHGAIVT